MHGPHRCIWTICGLQVMREVPTNFHVTPLFPGPVPPPFLLIRNPQGKKRSPLFLKKLRTHLLFSCFMSILRIFSVLYHDIILVSLPFEEGYLLSHVDIKGNIVPHKTSLIFPNVTKLMWQVKTISSRFPFTYCLHPCISINSMYIC